MVVPSGTSTVRPWLDRGASPGRAQPRQTVTIFVPRTRRGAVRAISRRVPLEDGRHVGEGLRAVDQRRLAVQALHGGVLEGEDRAEAACPPALE